MFRQKTAPRQLLLRCTSTDIPVGMRFLHYPHPGGADERYTPQGGTWSSELMDEKELVLLAYCAAWVLAPDGTKSPVKWVIFSLSKCTVMRSLVCVPLALFIS